MGKSLARAEIHRNEILELKTKNISVKDMADHFQISESLMHKWIRILHIGRPKRPSVPKTKEIGRPKNSLSKSEARAIIRKYRKVRSVSEMAKRENVSVATMSRTIRKALDTCNLTKQDIKNW